MGKTTVARVDECDWLIKHRHRFNREQTLLPPRVHNLFFRNERRSDQID
jgi:hypothetical protein